MIAGIDPGANGGIAILNHEMKLIFASKLAPLLELGSLADILVAQGVTLVFVEKAQAFPGQGVASTFATGYGAGLIVGTMVGRKIPHVLVAPRTWTKWAHAGTGKGHPKVRSLAASQRYWPGFDFRASAKCKKPHDGIIDACLIAGWGLTQHVRTMSDTTATIRTSAGPGVALYSALSEKH